MRFNVVNMFYNIFLLMKEGRNNRLSTVIMLLITVVATLSVASCRGSSNGNADNEVTVAVSIPPLKYFAEAIGGDSVNVVSLLNENSDPETFQPGVSTFRAIAGSRVFLGVGVLPFEEALLGNLKANNPDLKIKDVSAGIELIYGTHSHAGVEHDGHSNDVGEADPHIWSSVKNARVIARNVLDALTEADPSNEVYFRERYDRFSERLDSFDMACSRKLEALPSRNFAIWHPSLSYLARDYGLRQIAFNLENKETSSVRLGDQIDKAKEARLSAFFVPAGINDSQTKVIAQEIGLPPVTINPMSGQWDVEINKIVNALAASAE